MVLDFAYFNKVYRFRAVHQNRAVLSFYTLFIKIVYKWILLMGTDFYSFINCKNHGGVFVNV
jgi:hypothetical protein